MKRFLFPALAIVTLALAGCQPKADDAAFGAKVEKYLYAHPEVVEVAITLRNAENFAPRVAKYRTQLTADPRDLVINPKGKITVVEFFDYRCGYCKLVAPDVVKLVQDNPDVRVVFKELPIFGEVSDTAARMALTPQAKAKGFKLYASLMADNGLDEAGLDRHLSDAGLDPAVVRAAAASPQVQAQLLETRALAGALGVEGTPAFVVGDYMIPSANIAAVRAAIARVRDEGPKPAGSPT
jgi:protein-disulfide isomerase